LCVELAATLELDLLTLKQNREKKNIFFGHIRTITLQAANITKKIRAASALSLVILIYQ
jgi:hypothetical protein